MMSDESALTESAYFGGQSLLVAIGGYTHTHTHTHIIVIIEVSTRVPL